MLSTFDVGENSRLNTLFLNDNNLKSLNLRNSNSITYLYIQNNKELKQVDYLPLSLTNLHADRHIVLPIDFQPLTCLDRLSVYNG
jgi:hypothetical protein